MSAMEYDNDHGGDGNGGEQAMDCSRRLHAFVMWAVMMVGMMAPSAAPVLVLFAGMKRQATNIRAWGWRSRFSGWATSLSGPVSALGAALAQWALHRRAMLSAAMTARALLLRARFLSRPAHIS